jgi:hypothetical protein
MVGAAMPEQQLALQMGQELVAEAPRLLVILDLVEPALPI